MLVLSALLVRSPAQAATGWEDLPEGLLSQIASGRDDLKVMRRVCGAWERGYNCSVTKVNLRGGNILTTASGRLAEK